MIRAMQPPADRIAKRTSAAQALRAADHTAHRVSVPADRTAVRAPATGKN